MKMIGLGILLGLVQTLASAEIIDDRLKQLSSAEIAKKLSESKSFGAPLQQIEKDLGKTREISDVARVLATNNKNFKETLQGLEELKFLNYKDLLAEVTKSAEGYDFAQTELIFVCAVKWAQVRNYEDALGLLKEINPKVVSHPLAYYFYKAACDQKLRLKDEALDDIEKMFKRVVPSEDSERYLEVAVRMKEEISEWKPDLGEIARRMGEVEERLDNKKGGKETQKRQAEIVKLLDEQIKEIEDQMKQQNQSQQQASGQRQQQMPATDSKIMNGEGKGEVANKKLIQSGEVWGKMPEKEKVKALEALNRQLPPHIREAAEGFSKKLQNPDNRKK